MISVSPSLFFLSVHYYPLLLPWLGPYILQRVCGYYHPGTLSSFKVCTFDPVHHSMADTKWFVQACHGTRPPPSQDLKHSPASPSAHRPSRVTLTWSSGYFGGCVCCPHPSTFHCGRTLRSPSEAPPKPLRSLQALTLLHFGPHK